MCGKLNCSMWMLSKWNYFGDILGEGVEAIKNNNHGLWGRHPTDIPASFSLLHETFWTAAGTTTALQLWHLHLTKSVALWHHHQCPPLLKNPLETFVLPSRECPSLHARSVTCLTVPAPLWPAVFRTCCTLHLKELVCPLYSLDLSLCDFHVFSPNVKALKLL